METQFIKTGFFALIFFISLSGIKPDSKSDVRGKIQFEITNYKKIYKPTDIVCLSVINVCNKPLWYEIGVETETDDGWLEYYPDIKNINPLRDVATEYILLKPYCTKLIKIKVMNLGAFALKKNKVSNPTRFFLKYAKQFNKSFSLEGIKIVSETFIENSY